MPTLVLVRDLLFASKIMSTATAVGVAVKLIRDPVTLADETADRLIVDLNQDNALPAALAWKAADPARRAVGFVSHVDGETIKAARQGGIDRVLARSEFVKLLPDLLRS